MKKVLIISPYFPPSNAADMQRVRTSLYYFREFGWEAEVVTVAAEYSELPQDNLLLKSIPEKIKIHKVRALEKRWTSKLGLGSLGLRSLLAYRKRVNRLLKEEPFDLVYFSTTQFPVCALGALWKKKFNIPYVIDMQDPWHTGSYYIERSKDGRRFKSRLMYGIHKYLERIAMKSVGGLISVSQRYIDDLKQKYTAIRHVPTETITFGVSERDIQITEQNHSSFENLLDPTTTNLVYIGRGGEDMHRAISLLFAAYKKGLTVKPQTFRQIKMYFIGTSYAPASQGKQTVMPLAKRFEIENNVIEITGRINYFQTLFTLKQADALFVPGSDDPKYTASKIYPYLLVKKPLLTIFDRESSANCVLEEYGIKHVFDFTSATEDAILSFLCQVASGQISPDDYNPDAVKKYSARSLTEKQCTVFEKVTMDDHKKTYKRPV